jgi:hypothetical protein
MRKLGPLRRRLPRVPADMRIAAPLPPRARAPVAQRHALLINLFYPKDPRTSFGKHVEHSRARHLRFRLRTEQAAAHGGGACVSPGV